MIRTTSDYVVYEIVPGEDRACIDDECYSSGWYYRLATNIEQMTYWPPIGPFDSQALAQEAAELSTDRHAVLT